MSADLDLDALQALTDAAPEGPWFLSDCEGTLQIWREAVLRNVTRDETGEITGYRDPARWRPGDLIGEWDLDTWDPGVDDDDDRIRAIAEFIALARTAVPALLALVRDQAAQIDWVRDLVERAERHGYDLDPEQVRTALDGVPAEEPTP